MVKCSSGRLLVWSIASSSAESWSPWSSGQVLSEYTVDIFQLKAYRTKWTCNMLHSNAVVDIFHDKTYKNICSQP